MVTLPRRTQCLTRLLLPGSIPRITREAPSRITEIETERGPVPLHQGEIDPEIDLEDLGPSTTAERGSPAETMTSPPRKPRLALDQTKRKVSFLILILGTGLLLLHPLLL